MNPSIPHLRIVVSVSAFVLVGFSAISAFVLGWSTDELTKGNIIGSWQNFAMLSVGFWLGSSSGGKQSPPSAPPPADAIEAAEQVATAAEDKRDEIKGT